MARSKTKRGQSELDMLDRLKHENKKLKQQIRRMKSELRTFESAFQKTHEFLDGKLSEVPTRDVIAAVARGKKLQSLVGQQREEEKARDKERRIKEKWLCHTCGMGHMGLSIFNRRDGVFYYRTCSNVECDNRTKMQKYTDDVEES